MKIVVIDDEILVRRGIMSMNWEYYGIEVAGEAADGETGLELVRRTLPDIVLSDIRMPKMDGLTMIRMIRDEFPEMKIIILSVLEDFESVRNALRLGVTDYVQKFLMGPDELLETVLNIKRIQDCTGKARPISKHDTLPDKLSDCELEKPEADFYGQALRPEDGARTHAAVSTSINFFAVEHLKQYYTVLEGPEEAIAREGFERLFPLDADECIAEQNIKNEICLWVSTVVSLMQEWGGNIQQFWNHSSPYNQISQAATYQQLRGWCLDFHMLAWETLHILKASHHRIEICKVIDYLHAHYMDQIQVTDMAHLTNLSVNYFSYLFSKEMGEPFVNYLQKVRVERAKELLRSNQLHWIDVGEQVGFRSTKYFAKIFKKYTSVSPSQYKY
ncbi:hypothetical protein ASG89_15530 [Paenibacillus sp. Soil766]|uniref:response regulator transcription factor n=1 Tax=Paenibacillus sp. Soil766 TaxID=1736404 RepID=UPI00070D808D|nr:response regulator [Paenibacillus sp. Soil766]KRF09627.1 hypothetical protein ASG89_15530 [Paenibacillus sp. Soil766]